jgi:hypothetical protein
MTDQEVRHAIKAIIAAAATTAKVYEWNALSHKLDEWPAIFRTGDVTHGWIIKRFGIESEWKNAVRDRQVWIYDIWGFYGFRSGKEGDNSDDEFAVIIDAIKTGFTAAPRLAIDDEVEKHEQLQVNVISTIDCGEETLHIAQCRLKVRLCC